MGFVDWTLAAWNETDPSSILTVAANQLTYAAPDSTPVSASQLWRNYGSGHFGDFTHYIDASKNSPRINLGWGTVWTLSNAGTINNYSSDNGLYCLFYDNGGIMQIYIEDLDNDKSDFYNGSHDTRYYLKLSRSGTTFTCVIYSDASHTSEVDTLTCTGVQNTTFSTLGCGGGPAASLVTNVLVYNLDIGEAESDSVTWTTGVTLGFS